MALVTSGFLPTRPGISRGSVQIAPGILTRVTIQPLKAFFTVGQIFWYGLLAHGPDPDNGVIDTLLAGYMTYPVGLSWNGFLEIPDGQFLIIEGITNTLFAQNATIADTRIVLTVDGTLTKYLLKVNGVTP